MITNPILKVNLVNITTYFKLIKKYYASTKDLSVENSLLIILKNDQISSTAESMREKWKLQ